MKKHEPRSRKLTPHNTCDKLPLSVRRKIDESDGSLERSEPSEPSLSLALVAMEIGRAIRDDIAPQQEYFGETEDGLTIVNEDESAND